MSWNDFSNAETQQNNFDVIPKGTPVKVILKIKAGQHVDPSLGSPDGALTRSDKTGALYLDCEFTVMGGKYNKRKIWSLIGVQSPKGPTWGNMGRTFIRAALESAAGVTPDDGSEKAMNARRIGKLSDLDGLQFAAFVDVEKGVGDYGDKNVIKNAMEATHKLYIQTMAGAGVTQTTSAATSQLGQTTATAPAWAG